MRRGRPALERDRQGQLQHEHHDALRAAGREAGPRVREEQAEAVSREGQADKHRLPVLVQLQRAPEGRVYRRRDAEEAARVRPLPDGLQDGQEGQGLLGHQVGGRGRVGAQRRGTTSTAARAG